MPVHQTHLDMVYDVHQRIRHHLQQTQLHDIRRATQHDQSQTTHAHRRTHWHAGLVRGTQHR